MSQAGGEIDAKALARWWATLGDPTLEKIVEQALARNLDLRQALAGIEGARALLARGHGGGVARGAPPGPVEHVDAGDAHFVRGAAEDARKDVGLSVEEVRIVVPPLCNQPEVARDVGVRRAGPLAVDDFMVVARIRDICRAHLRVSP